MACKEGQFDVVELMANDRFKTFCINLNAQHVNGMTPFDLALSTVIRYTRVRVVVIIFVVGVGGGMEIRVRVSRWLTLQATGTSAIF